MSWFMSTFSSGVGGGGSGGGGWRQQQQTRQLPQMSEEDMRAMFTYPEDAAGPVEAMPEDKRAALMLRGCPLLRSLRDPNPHNRPPRGALRQFSLYRPDDADRSVVQRHLFAAATAVEEAKQQQSNREDREDQEDQEDQEEQKEETSRLSVEEDRALGIILCMAAGDALGHTFEFTPVTYNRPASECLEEIVGGGAFQLEPGQFTDDASMGMCMADSFLSCGEFDPFDLLLRFVAWWHMGYNAAPMHAVGLGGTIGASLRLFTEFPLPFTTTGGPRSSGNGSLMRLAAVPIFFHSDETRGMQVAALQSRTTHQGIEAAECARLMTMLCIRAIHRDAAEQGVHALLESIATFDTPAESVALLARSEAETDAHGNVDPDRDWNWKQENYRFSPQRAAENPGYVGGYAMDALSMALHCVWSTDSLKAAVLKSANMGGDADTVGAITGQIAGAIYGAQDMPRSWIESLQQWDNQGDIALRGYKLFHRRGLHETEPLGAGATSEAQAETAAAATAAVAAAAAVAETSTNGEREMEAEEASSASQQQHQQQP